MGNLKNKELELFDKYKTRGNKKAKKDLLVSLKPLIYKQVFKWQGSGLPGTALKLEGHRLAGQAIDSYDPSKSQLNTHVTNYLKKMSRYVTNYQNVGHIPEPRALIIGKYNVAFANLEAEKGREPTVDELADNLQINPIEVERLQTELRKDLGIRIEETDEDNLSGFYFHAEQPGTDPKLKQAIEFVYYDSDPINKKILEYTFGLNNKRQLLSKDIELKLRLSSFELKKRREVLAKEISELSHVN